VIQHHVANYENTPLRHRLEELSEVCWLGHGSKTGWGSKWGSMAALFQLVSHGGKLLNGGTIQIESVFMAMFLSRQSSLWMVHIEWPNKGVTGEHFLDFDSAHVFFQEDDLDLLQKRAEAAKDCNFVNFRIDL